MQAVLGQAEGVLPLSFTERRGVRNSVLEVLAKGDDETALDYVIRHDEDGGYGYMNVSSRVDGVQEWHFQFEALRSFVLLPALPPT